MKIVLFTAGLGNQVFQYFFCQWLQQRYPNEKVWGCYDPAILANHNGLEIDRVFDIALPPTSRCVYWIERVIRAIYKRTHCPSLSSHDEADKDTLYYEGYWHDKRFFTDFVSHLRFRDDAPVSAENQQALAEIHSTHSVSIHIRRGDYLNPEFEARFAHSCPLDYYSRAIAYAQALWPDVRFFVFSDDIPWVREHLPLTNALFVDWNQGARSAWDMRLMSECKASIIANSSFSFWGAMLGVRKQFVIRPKRWIGDEVPDIFPDDWLSY